MYVSFISLHSQPLFMQLSILQLIIEGGTAFVVFVRCFTNGKEIASESKEILHAEIPKGVLAAISVISYKSHELFWISLETKMLVCSNNYELPVSADVSGATDGI